MPGTRKNERVDRLANWEALRASAGAGTDPTPVKRLQAEDAN
jgi:hypothetical protein